MKYIITLALSVVVLSASAQNLPERGELRRGNDSYLDGDYATAAEHYSRSMALSPESFEPRFNLGSALIRNQKTEEAQKLLKSLATDSLRSDRDRSNAYYNIGNSQFMQQKLEEALESYKDAIRLDPNDMEAKYNYIYTKALLEQQEQNQDQNEDKQDQDQDKQESGEDNQDQNQDQQEGDQEQDQNQDQQDGDQEQNQDEQPQDQGEQPQDGEISDQVQQQMLDAIQAQEDKTQDELEKRARGAVMQSPKNW